MNNYHETVKIVILSFNTPKRKILEIFVITKSRDWVAANPSIRDWSRIGWNGQKSWDCNHYIW